jgi:hypothetical protein
VAARVVGRDALERLLVVRAAHHPLSEGVLLLERQFVVLEAHACSAGHQQCENESRHVDVRRYDLYGLPALPDLLL